MVRGVVPFFSGIRIIGTDVYPSKEILAPEMVQFCAFSYYLGFPVKGLNPEVDSGLKTAVKWLSPSRPLSL